MTNLRMRERLDKGECLDVRMMGKEVEPGLFQLDYFKEGVDYCDAQHEAWIWSIGRDNETGYIFASTTAEFYQNTRFECLWLR